MNQSKLYCDQTFRRHFSVIIPVLSHEIILFLSDVLCCKQALLFLDIIFVLSSRLISTILRFAGLEIQRANQFSTEMLHDTEAVFKGDILKISNRIVIVKNKDIKGQYGSNQRLFIKLMCTEHKLFASESVKLLKLAFEPDEMVVLTKSTKTTRMNLLSIAKQMVESAFVPLGLSKLNPLKASVFSTKCTLSKVNTVQNGDFVFCLHEGKYYKGVVVENRLVPSILYIEAYNIDKDGIVQENEHKIDFSKTNVWTHKYDDLDSIQRDRILKLMEILDQKSLSTYGLESIESFLTIVNRNINVNRFKYFIIQVAEICLESNQFPRIQNLENWMNQQRCVKTPHYLCIKTRSTEICFSSKVILVSNTENALNLSNILRTKHEMVHPTNSFLLPTRAKEIFLETQRTQVLPYVTVCVLTATDIGTLTKQDKDVLKVIEDGDLEKCIFLLNRSSKNDHRDLRKTVSENITKIINKTPRENSVYLNLFFLNESEFQKRLACVIENQINSQIRNKLKALQPFLEKNEGINGSKHDVLSYADTLRRLCDALPSENVVRKHRVEVLMQRNKDIEAFSFEGCKLEVFSQSSEAVISESFSQFLTSDEMKSIKLTIKQWMGPPKTIPFHLKQGSKIKTRNTNTDDGFGTVGMFVRDSMGQIYFTTCGHVIGNNAEAFSADPHSPVVGRSVYARRSSSITEEIDISVVKVNEQFISDCQYGLRDPDDKLVEGVVCYGQENEMNNLRCKNKLNKRNI